MDIIEFLAESLCQHDPARSFYWGVEPLPFCQRCSGVYCGALVSIIAILAVARPGSLRPPQWLVAASALTIPVMIVFGLHIWDPGPRVRFSVGMAFGLAVGVACSVAMYRWRPVLTGEKSPASSTRVFVAFAAMAGLMCLVVESITPIIYWASALGCAAAFTATNLAVARRLPLPRAVKSNWRIAITTVGFIAGELILLRWRHAG